MTLYPTTQPVATASRDRAAESVPVDLDPAAHPIIARHWFGVEPFRSIGRVEAYERLTPDLLKALGGDRFPPLPIHEVQS